MVIIHDAFSECWVEDRNPTYYNTFMVDDSPLPPEPLTRRERQVLELLAENLTNPEIAERLTLAPSSVKWYLQQIYQKLGAQDRKQAVLLARQAGILSSPRAAVEEQRPTRPSGTVTFLFSDIVGSTGLWESQPEAMKRNFPLQESIQRKAIAAYGGYTYKMVGDAFQAAFATAPAALEAALDIQRQLQSADWGQAPIWVRMALHSAVTEERARRLRRPRAQPHRPPAGQRSWRADPAQPVHLQPA